MSELDSNVRALQEILTVAKEAFAGGVPQEVQDDLARVTDALARLRALQVYRDNYDFLRGLGQHP